MDFGYCENAVVYDRLSSARRSLAMRGFSHEDVAERSEVEEREVFGDDKTEPMERLVSYGMCEERCDRCLEAHKSYRSGKWFGRANEACKAAMDKGMAPFFITLVLPDLAYPLPVKLDMRFRKEIYTTLYNEREEHARKQIEADMKEREYSPDFRIDDVVHWRASRHAENNLDSQMQIWHAKPCVRLSSASDLSAFKALNKRQLKRISQADPSEPLAYYIDPEGSDGENYKLGRAVSQAKSIENPTYGYVRHSFQRWIKRLRHGTRGFPAYKLSFLAFPEEGTQGSQRYHYHMVLFVEGGFETKEQQQQFKECCRLHWHAVSGNIRFPEDDNPDPVKAERWFDVTRDSSQVANYVAKYVSKETLQSERVLASKGFNWTQAVRDAALHRRGLIDTPPAAYDWTDGMQYQSPLDDDAIPATSLWVGVDIQRRSERMNVSTAKDGTRRVGKRDKLASHNVPSQFQSPKVSVVAVAYTREPVNHPAQATRLKVSSGGMIDENTVGSYTWFPVDTFQRFFLNYHIQHTFPEGSAEAVLRDWYAECRKGVNEFEYQSEHVAYFKAEDLAERGIEPMPDIFAGKDMSRVPDSARNEIIAEMRQAVLDTFSENVQSPERMLAELYKLREELDVNSIIWR